MTRYIAFLRAINVGRGRTIKMDVLRRIFQSAGLENVSTYTASGNVVFETSGSNPAALERKIEDELLTTLGYEVATFIRTAAEVASIARYQPFPVSGTGPADLNIIFFAAPLDAAARKKVLSLRASTDDFVVRGREIYWLRRNPPGEYGSAGAQLDQTLGQPFTVRSARTIKKLAAEYCT